MLLLSAVFLPSTRLDNIFYLQDMDEEDDDEDDEDEDDEDESDESEEEELKIEAPPPKVKHPLVI